MKYLIIILSFLIFNSCKNKSNTDPDQQDNRASTATEHHVKFKNFDCYDGTQKEMNDCARREYKYLESLMNNCHNALITDLNQRIAEDTENQHIILLKDRYLNSQKHWINLRNKNSSLIRDQYNNGSMQTMAIYMQRITDTKHRIEFIEAFSDGFN